MKQLIEVLVGNKAVLKLKTWKDEKWVTEKVIYNIFIGEAGTTLNKVEGDKKTPLGLFKLGPLFGTCGGNYSYPYIKISENSYWVDDYDSPYYNKWVEVNGKLNSEYPYIVNAENINWKSAEQLIDYPKEYELGFIIEYNTENPYDEITKGNKKGSAIFMHASSGKATKGCIAIATQELKMIANWIDKNKNPHVLIKNSQKEN